MGYVGLKAVDKSQTFQLGFAQGKPKPGTGSSVGSRMRPACGMRASWTSMPSTGPSRPRRSSALGTNSSTPRTISRCVLPRWS